MAAEQMANTNKAAAANTLLQKQEYIAVDLFRIVLSFFVIALHLGPFASTNAALNDWVVQVLTRFAVPFFFLASGYFSANKLADAKATFSYLGRLLFLYLLYNVIYLPMALYRWQLMDGTMAGLKQMFYLFFITGVFEHLWFFLGLAVAVLCLFFLNRFFSCLQVLAVSILLYLGAMFAITYHAWLGTVPVIRVLIGYYYKYCYTLRNGVFFGLPLVALGYAFFIYRAKIKQSGWYFIAFLLSFGLMQLEVQHIDFATVINGDMYWMLPVVALFFFLWVCSCKVPVRFAFLGKTMRQISVVMYGLHMLVYYLLLLYWYQFTSYLLTSIETYLIVCGVTFLLAYALVKLSRHKAFVWLRYLY